MDTHFNGFSKEMMEFLFELPFNNTLEKLPDNKEKYKMLITEPLTLLYRDLLPTVMKISSRLETKPTRCLSTPYTDRRFSPSTPLKDYLYLRFKLSGKNVDVPGLYFDLGPEGYSYGLRIYKQTSGGIEEIRQKVLLSPNEFNRVLTELKQNGFQIIGESYQKDHYASLPDCAAKELLNKKTFYIGKDKPVGELLFSKELADELATGFAQMKNLLNLL